MILIWIPTGILPAVVQGNSRLEKLTHSFKFWKSKIHLHGRTKGPHCPNRCQECPAIERCLHSLPYDTTCRLIATLARHPQIFWFLTQNKKWRSLRQNLDIFKEMIQIHGQSHNVSWINTKCSLCRVFRWEPFRKHLASLGLLKSSDDDNGELPDLH